LKTAEITAATLLSNNTNPNPAPNRDDSPLHIAAERGSAELVEMLIRLGADVDAKNKNGLTAAQMAEKKGHQQVHQMLENQDQIPRTCRTSRSAYDVDGKPYNAPDISDIPLYLRRRLVGQSHSNLEYVQKEVAAEPRLVHSVATTSEICVEACAHIGRKPIVEFLLENGAPYSLPTAVMLNDMATVTRLLDEDPNRIQERGAHDFGLMWYPSIGRCPLDMTQLLLDRGAQVEQQHFLGTTALHWACLRGPIELVELLVENGADVNRVGRKFKADGETPLQSVRDEKIADYLRSKGAK
jgi:ankyrin repeat protein